MVEAVDSFYTHSTPKAFLFPMLFSCPDSSFLIAFPAFLRLVFSYSVTQRKLLIHRFTFEVFFFLFFFFNGKAFLKMYFIRFNYVYVSMAVSVCTRVQVSSWSSGVVGVTVLGIRLWWEEQPPPWMSSHQFYKT